MNFFGANITDDYVENNSEYADRYLEVLNDNIQNGYVSLSRILYFYLENDKLSFDEIYNDNLEIETKKQRPISEVCELEKYKNMIACKESKFDSSSQIDDDIYNPFVFPLDIKKMKITSFFMEERIVYDKSDIHQAWDFSALNETKVYSVCDGEVVYESFMFKENKTDIDGLGGNEIKIKCEVDDEITYTVWYAHLYPESSRVNVGDKVNTGQEIASVGTTGYSTGPHLHFQVQRDNTNVDGMSLIDFTSITDD